MYTGNENNEISYNDAAMLTANYREAQGGTDYIKGEYFSKSSIQALLDQTDCVGIRIYYGIDNNDVQRLVIVGVNANEDDMVNGLIMEHGNVCPPVCGAQNNLNS